MPKQESHTIFRFNLRSMLMLTFGVALVMAVASPFIRTLEAKEQLRLFSIAAAFFAGMVGTTFFITRRRRRLGLTCGPLLLSLPLKIQSNKKWLRWVWLLLLVPGVLSYLYYIAMMPNNATESTYFWFIRCLFLPAFWSISLTKMGLTLWTEGNANALEFCENGLFYAGHFFVWSAPTLQKLTWNLAQDKIMIEILINIRRTTNAVPVPVGEREAVDAIIISYFQNRSVVTDQS